MGNQISQNGCSLSHANRSPHCNGHTSTWLQASRRPVWPRIIHPCYRTCCHGQMLQAVCSSVLQWWPAWSGPTTCCLLKMVPACPKVSENRTMKTHTDGLPTPERGHWGTEQQTSRPAARRKPLHKDCQESRSAAGQEQLHAGQRKATTHTASTSYAARPRSFDGLIVTAAKIREIEAVKEGGRSFV